MGLAVTGIGSGFKVGLNELNRVLGCTFLFEGFVARVERKSVLIDSGLVGHCLVLPRGRGFKGWILVEPQ